MSVPVSIGDFRSQFSELAAIPDPQVIAALQTASLWFDYSRWDPRDYKLAYLFWTAHYLILQKMQSQVTQVGNGVTAIDLFVQSVSFGERRVSYAQRQGQNQLQNDFPGEELLGLTLYGQLYKQIRARNIIPIVVI